jgi:hypothetical protein
VGAAMAGKIDELLNRDKWKKKNYLKTTLEIKEEEERAFEIAKREVEEREKEEERQRLETAKNSTHGANVEAFKTPAMETHYDCQNPRLGHTGPVPWADKQYRQGGNANPKRRRGHPSGHHNCGS